MQHSIDRLTMELPNISKMIWSTTTSQTPSQDSENSSKLLTHDTGNKKENSPVKPELLDHPETSLNRSLILTGLITSLARFFQLQAEEQQLWLYPGQGLNFRTEEVHHSQPFFKTQERWKANSTGTSVMS